LVGFDVLQQQVNLIRRFNSIVQTPDSGITLVEYILDINEWISKSQKLLKLNGGS